MPCSRAFWGGVSVRPAPQALTRAPCKRSWGSPWRLRAGERDSGRARWQHAGHRTEVQADNSHPQVKRKGEGACTDVLDALERTEYCCRVDCML